MPNPRKALRRSAPSYFAACSVNNAATAEAKPARVVSAMGQWHFLPQSSEHERSLLDSFDNLVEQRLNAAPFLAQLADVRART